MGQHQSADAAARSEAPSDPASLARWRYPASARLRDARAQYFLRAGFSAETYTDRWVTLSVAGRSFRAFPNTAGRVRAVKLHDLHHVLTGYPTSWVGEAEIGAWELASGCRNFWAAWWLNFSAAFVGMFIAPRRVLRAFQRGRRQGNLYGEELSDALLDETVGALHARLGIDAA